jgi:hypothetical protein
MAKENQYEYQNDDVDQQEYYSTMKPDETKQTKDFIGTKEFVFSLLYS